MSHAIGEHHADYLEEQLAAGGLLIWVWVRSVRQEHEIVELFNNLGGGDVHVHTIIRYWGLDEIRLHDFDPDSFLEQFPT